MYCRSGVYRRKASWTNFLSYIGNPPELTDELKAVIEKDQKELAGLLVGSGRGILLSSAAETAAEETKTDAGTAGRRRKQ